MPDERQQPGQRHPRRVAQGQDQQGQERPGLPARDRPAGPRFRPGQERRHPLPARAQRLPPHRPRQVHLPELRHRPAVRRPVQPAHGRHQPHQRRRGVRRLHHHRRQVAHRRLGRPLPGPQAGRRHSRKRATTSGGRDDFYLPPVMPAEAAGQAARALLRLRLLRAPLRSTRWSSSARARPSSATTPPRRSTPCAARTDRPGQGEPLPQPLRRREPRPVCSGCAPASSPTAPAPCAPRST